MFQMERLTAEPEGLNRLLRHLSGGEIEFDSVPEGVFEKGPAHHGGDDDPAAAFKSLPRWQRRAFCEGLRPQAHALYTELGYDMSFVAPGAE